ncbi:hypothetical protein ALC53_09558 [Atta colombica]|uniref:Uncharacterized protein n=1 Tax=Atta colombica TaxID=520822 RepID=A0A195B6Z6_9HYME|nr:hypothetical protein ALC53_09558 [Atta colombica]
MNPSQDIEPKSGTFTFSSGRFLNRRIATAYSKGVHFEPPCEDKGEEAIVSAKGWGGQKTETMGGSSESRLRNYDRAYIIHRLHARFPRTKNPGSHAKRIFETDIFESLSLIVSSSPAVAIDGRLIGTRNRTHDRPLTHANQTVSLSLSRNRGTCRRDNFGGTPQLWRTEQNSDFVEAVSPIGDGGTRVCRSKPRARRAVAT